LLKDPELVPPTDWLRGTPDYGITVPAVLEAAHRGTVSGRWLAEHVPEIPVH
jgi:hypothetical protein